jgi:dephospho-CoA kinase
MLVVGVTGGIGSGKSTVASLLAARGAVVVDADALAREAIDVGTPGLASVVDRFGRDILDASGGVDRRKLAEIVFADDDARRWQEALLHPLIAERFARWRDEQQAAGAPLLVHEAPTLFEAGVQDRYDVILTVTAPAELRERRRAGAAQRMAHQLSEQEKAARSDYVYENAGDLEQLDRFVAGLVRELAR